jgi:hypothetical protein
VALIAKKVPIKHRGVVWPGKKMTYDFGFFFNRGFEFPFKGPLSRNAQKPKKIEKGKK